MSIRVCLAYALILLAVGTAQAQASLETPELLYPENNDWFEPHHPFWFDCCYTPFWSSVDSADGYGLEVYEDSLLTTLALPDTTVADTLLNFHDAEWGLDIFRRYFWRVRAVKDTLSGPWTESQSFVVYFPVSVEPSEKPPPAPQLVAAYPNPSTSRIVIHYETPGFAHVVLDVFDVLGRRTESLTTGLQPPGFHETIWRPKNLASGVYVVRLQSGSATDSRTIVVTDP